MCEGVCARFEQSYGIVDAEAKTHRTFSCRDALGWFDDEAEHRAVEASDGACGQRLGWLRQDSKEYFRVVVQLGDKVITTASKTQLVVALSSGGAEFYALHYAAIEGLYVQSLIHELMGIILPVVIFTDSTAAKAMATRQGVGRVKHIQVKMLWIQQLCQEKLVEIRKVSSAMNLADLMTKPVDATTLRTLGALMGIYTNEVEKEYQVEQLDNKKTKAVKGRGLVAALAAMSMTCCVGEQCTAVGFLTAPEETSSGWMMTTVFVIMVILLYELAKFVITAAAKRIWPGKVNGKISRHSQCDIVEGEVLVFHLAPSWGVRTRREVPHQSRVSWTENGKSGRNQNQGTMFVLHGRDRAMTSRILNCEVLAGDGTTLH